MLDYRLTWCLRRSQGQWVDRQELAQVLDDQEEASGGRPAATGRHASADSFRHESSHTTTISAALDEMSRQGFIINQHPMLGVRLEGVPPTIDRDEIAFACRRLRIGRRVIIYNQTSSTNDVAAHVASAGPAAHGTVILAESQTAGRGRQGAPWLDSPGQSLLLSIPLWLSQPPMLAAASALAEAMEETTGLSIGIKWPNDLEIDRRKVAGILIEGGRSNATATSHEKSLYIFGVGINVNQPTEAFPPELRQRATSLAIVCGEPIDRTLLLERVMVHLDAALADLEAGRRDQLRQRYDAHGDMVGRTVAVVEAGRTHRGTVVSISPQYALVVRLDDSATVRAFDAANVRLV